jgi:drug/metabolite transporter (DMT)-like permease
VIQKSVVARTSVLQITWLACIAAAAACSVFTLRLIDDVRAAPASAIGWIVYLGVGPTALGFVTWAYALSRMTAGRLASLAYLIPVVAILLGWGVLGETPPGLAVAGGALCVGGVALARG